MAYDWFKLHSKGWLHGSIRAQLSIGERSVWADLLALANESRVRGVICRAKGIPYTREYIAAILEIPLDLLNSTIDKCLKDENADDPNTRIMLDPDGSIRIANWERYNSVPEHTNKKGQADDSRVYGDFDPETALYEGMTIETGIEIAEGRRNATEFNIRRVKDELDKRGIPYKKGV